MLHESGLVAGAGIMVSGHGSIARHEGKVAQEGTGAARIVGRDGISQLIKGDVEGWCGVLEEEGSARIHVVLRRVRGRCSAVYLKLAFFLTFRT